MYLNLKQPAGNTLDKIVSGYQTIYGGQVNEDAVISKCVNAISFVEKVDKEIGGDIKSGTLFSFAIINLFNCI